MNNYLNDYVRARKVLFDGLDALQGQRNALILVGAQAIYVHTKPDLASGDEFTTDGDLAVDVQLLTDSPDIEQAMQSAGFQPGSNPGQWSGEAGVQLDLMVAPHQGNRSSKSARSAQIPPHGKRSARVTPGLEAALVDNSVHELHALSDSDSRRVHLRVANPSALLVAKLIKLEERYDAARAGSGKPSRVLAKDALDCHRLLLAIETSALVEGFRRHAADEFAGPASARAIAFLRQQHERGHDGLLSSLLRSNTEGDREVTAQFASLCSHLLEAI